MLLLRFVKSPLMLLLTLIPPLRQLHLSLGDHAQPHIMGLSTMKSNLRKVSIGDYDESSVLVADVVGTPPSSTHSDTIGLESSTFLGSVEPRPDLPICQSGNDFLSTERGGDWKKDLSYTKPKSVFDGFDFKEHLSRASCDSPHYNDPYVWSASCRMPPPTAEEQSPPVRVMLAGDSITKQIYDTSLAMMDTETRMEISNIYVIPMLKSAKFTSKVCPSCGDALMESPELFDRDLKWVDDDEFLAPYLDQDYVFYNEYAHFTGKIVHAVMRLSAQQQQGSSTDAENYQEKPDPVLVSELYHWFEQQMEHKAKLFATVSTAKVYYSTAPPHAIGDAPAHAIWDVVRHADADNGDDKQPNAMNSMKEPLPVPTREATTDECYHYGSYFGGAFCYSLVNHIAATAFESNNLEVLDLAPTMSRRVDAHPCRVDDTGDDEPTSKDCLHFCMPGPPSVMLAAILVQVRSHQHSIISSRQQQQQHNILASSV